MLKNKIIVVRVFHITAWVIIILLTCYVLLKSCVIFTSANMRQTMKQFEQGVTLDIGMNMVKSNVPILKYINSQNNEYHTGGNSFIGHLIRIFPINKYLLDTKEDVLYADSSSLFHQVYFENNILNKNDTTEEEYHNEDNFISGDVSLIYGEIYYEDETTDNVEEDSKETISSHVGKIYTLNQLKDFNFLMTNFYNVASSTKALKSVFNGEEFLKKDFTMDINTKKPQILIFHTHSQEGYANSRSGKSEDSVVGVGSYLTEILTEKYGLNVIHDTYENDIINGSLERSKAYNVAEKRIAKILEKYPSIEVIIDLHRDDGAKRVTTINGKKTAQIMFFNGLSRNNKGPIDYLYNPYIKDNLAFSLQMKLKADEKYPGLTKKIYLKGYRYNLHFLPKSTLIELGTDENTLQEAKNAMEPFAEVLYQVLSGETIE